MGDVICPFCGVDGSVVRNEGTEFVEKDGSVKPLFGVSFIEHIGDCPFRFVGRYRADYYSAREAISAFTPKFSNRISVSPLEEVCSRCGGTHNNGCPDPR